MDVDTAADLLRQCLFMAVLISAPILVVGLVVGVVVSLIQAVTQVHDQALTFVPRILAMGVAAFVLMPWVGNRLGEYAVSMFAFTP